MSSSSVPWWSVPDWWAAIGTISAVVVAIFGEAIWSYWRRPQLVVSMTAEPPDCHKTRFTKDTGEVVADCYYFRLRITNTGKRRAEDVEVYAAQVEKEHDGLYTTISDFPPMDLNWSHVRRPFQSISPGVSRHCDLAYVALPVLNGPETIQRDMALRVGGLKFVLDLEVIPNRGTFQLAAGTYRLTLIVAAANVKAKNHQFQIIHTGNWHDEEAKMFERGVRIKQLS